MLFRLLLSLHLLVPQMVVSSPPVPQQNLNAILISLEDRLRTLDSIYANIDTRLDQYGRKLEQLDSKLNRMDTVTSLQLDKISENISSKNFKDDIAKTTLHRKIDNTYDAIVHRLTYFENKLETTVSKMQFKLDSTQTKLSKLENTLTTRDSDVEAELTFIVGALDDLKTTCMGVEERLLSAQKESINKTVEETERLLKGLDFENIYKRLRLLNETVAQSIELGHRSAVEMKAATERISEEANAYANKVADMFTEKWTFANKLEETLQKLEHSMHASKTENQNSFRSLALQVGKLSIKEDMVEAPSADQKLIQMNRKMDKNFEELFLKQDLLLEKLQMDETDLEAKISEMFEKLIDTIQNKITLGPKDIKNLEQLVKNLGNSARRNLQNVGSSINNLVEKITKGNEHVSAILYEEINKLQAFCGLKKYGDDIGESATDYMINEAILHTIRELESKNNIFQENIAVFVQNNTKDCNVFGKLKKIHDILNKIEQNVNTNTETIPTVLSHKNAADEADNNNLSLATTDATSSDSDEGTTTEPSLHTSKTTYDLVEDDY